MRVYAFLLAGVAGALVACGAGDRLPTLGLRGTILTPTTVVAGGVVVITGNRIERIVRDPAALHDIQVIDTDGIVLPGLVDLHNHILWSVFPRWHAHGAFANRDSWREASAYLERYSRPQSALRRTHACDMNRFGEVRAVAGGVSSVVGSLHAPCASGLARNLDNDVQSAFGEKRSRAYTLLDVDDISPRDAARLAARLRADEGARLFVHVAEGRADDVGAKQEFARLVEYGLLTDKTVIVHGNGLDDAQFEAIAAAGASLVWSPRSNLELYGETISIAMALDRNIPIALAPDWSITGSTNLLEELRYAAAWLRTNVGDALSDRQLVEMVTSVPAMAAGIADQAGSIASGLYADVLVIRAPGGDPYGAVVRAQASDVRLVMIDGKPVYGVPDLLRKLHSRWDLETVELCGMSMAVDTTAYGPSLFDRRDRFSQTKERLNTALARLRPGLQLPPIADCAGIPE